MQRRSGAGDSVMSIDRVPTIVGAAAVPRQPDMLACNYSRVEERWEVELRPDGSARASVVILREQQIGQDHRWRFIARRELPLAAARRSRLGLTAACVAMLAAATALWAAWTRPIPPSPVTLALPVASPTPRPVIIAPPSPDSLAKVSAPETAPMRSPVPLIFPLERPKPTSPASQTAGPVLAVQNGPVDARPAVRDAIARAFASGEAEAWSDDGLTGFVVVGPAEAAASGVCRNTVILVRGGVDGDRTISRRRCQAAGGALVARDNP